MCTDAYREALTRDLASKASSAPAPRQRQIAEAGREGAVRPPFRRRPNPGQDDPENRGATAAGTATESGPAIALVFP
jgi:hypothetical protein